MHSFDFIEPASGEATYDFNFGREGISYYFVLAGTSNNFNSIWCDENSSLSNGKLYTSTNDSLSIINLNTHTVDEFYDATTGGQIQEPLISNDIVDINISR